MEGHDWAQRTGSFGRMVVGAVTTDPVLGSEWYAEVARWDLAVIEHWERAVEGCR